MLDTSSGEADDAVRFGGVRLEAAQSEVSVSPLRR